ncbi:hypothetical protein [Crocinitomix catalasitica]|uniref:hypothetical protein n=1 Tax=Crocinitomix catalasitica TaxID=184607 RepID=UPI000483ED7E|nr:hypothetical protein [Crocinitomix catalasitica]
MKTIRLILFIAFTCLSLFSCSSWSNKKEEVAGELIQGELYFKLIDFGSYYGFSDDIIEEFENYVDSLTKVDVISDNDRYVRDFTEILKQNDLIYLPYFNLKVDSIHKVKVYLSEKEYKKIQQYNHQELINENQKVTIRLKGEYVHDDIVKCTEIISTDKVEGKTYWRK